jgi:hypothetical protein
MSLTTDEIIFAKTMKYWSEQPNETMSLKQAHTFIEAQGGDDGLKAYFVNYMLKHGQVEFNDNKFSDTTVTFTEEMSCNW